METNNRAQPAKYVINRPVPHTLGLSFIQ